MASEGIATKAIFFAEAIASHHQGPPLRMDYCSDLFRFELLARTPDGELFPYRLAHLD